MTNIPGHNQIFQQSGVAQELSQQANAPKPGPEQAATQQQAQQVVQNSTVQNTDESELLKEKKEKEETRQMRKAQKRKKRNQKEKLALDPDATGRLLDTTV